MSATTFAAFDKTGPIDSITAAVDLIASAGVEVPDAFTAVRRAWNLVTVDPSTARADLVAAIAEGRDADIGRLTLAASLAATVNPGPTRGMIAPDVTGMLRAAWAPVAQSAYHTVAASFDSIAAELAKLAEIVDIEADPAALVGKPQKQQTAWLAAAEQAAELDRLLPALVAAARLAGVKALPPSHGGRSDDWTFGLSCDPGTAHRRRAWEAWESRGRCGRWSALIAAGVKIGTAPLDKPRHYNRPDDVEITHERVRANGFIGYREVQTDPADTEYAAQVQAK